MFGDWVRRGGWVGLREVDVGWDLVVARLREGVMHVWEKDDEMQDESQMKHNQRNQK